MMNKESKYDKEINHKNERENKKQVNWEQQKKLMKGCLNLDANDNIKQI